MQIVIAPIGPVGPARIYAVYAPERNFACLSLSPDPYFALRALETTRASRDCVLAATRNRHGVVCVNRTAPEVSRWVSSGRIGVYLFPVERPESLAGDWYALYPTPVLQLDEDEDDGDEEDFDD